MIAYMVARRRNEIGVRIALGAGGGRVIRLVLREAALLLIVGLAASTGLAVWVGQAASALLLGLKPYDPATLGGAIALLSVVALPPATDQPAAHRGWSPCRLCARSEGALESSRVIALPTGRDPRWYEKAGLPTGMRYAPNRRTQSGAKRRPAI